VIQLIGCSAIRVSTSRRQASGSSPLSVAVPIKLYIAAARSLRVGKRAAAIMSLIQSARLNGHEPFAYLKDVLTRLPTQPQSRIGESLPHRWKRADAATP
jgi:hypothetical protein